LLFRVFVAVEAALGLIREIRAEVQEEGSEVALPAIKVEVIHQGRGPHQPRIRSSGPFIPAALRTEQRRFLLRLPEEHHSLGLWELPALFGRAVILPLAFAERKDGHLLPPCQLFPRRHEALADRIHQSAGDELVTAMKSKEASATRLSL
jgi:hypothetical protein